jgi:hypothetical protein
MSDLKLFPFKETELYKYACAFARKCREIIFRLPKGYLSDSDQLKRASRSNGLILVLYFSFILFSAELFP